MEERGKGLGLKSVEESGCLSSTILEETSRDGRKLRVETIGVKREQETRGSSLTNNTLTKPIIETHYN